MKGGPAACRLVVPSSSHQDNDAVVDVIVT